jgi:hypothetical protein
MKLKEMNWPIILHRMYLLSWAGLFFMMAGTVLHELSKGISLYADHVGMLTIGFLVPPILKAVVLWALDIKKEKTS